MSCLAKFWNDGDIAAGRRGDMEMSTQMRDTLRDLADKMSSRMLSITHTDTQLHLWWQAERVKKRNLQEVLVKSHSAKSSKEL